MFGINRKRRFERAVAQEIDYMLGLHVEAGRAAAAAADRSRRDNLPGSRIKVLQEAAIRLSLRALKDTPEAG